jgi:hypothetical protein
VSSWWYLLLIMYVFPVVALYAGGVVQGLEWYWTFPLGAVIGWGFWDSYKAIRSAVER